MGSNSSHPFSKRASKRIIKSGRMRWAGHVARMGKMRNTYKILVGNLERKRQLGRPRCRWQDNIESNLREIWPEDVNCIRLTQDRNR
jgi:hypothetical protein